MPWGLPWVRTLRAVPRKRPRGAAPRGGCLPAASISPVRNGGKNTRGESFSPLDSPLWWALPWGLLLILIDWPAALCPTLASARPPAGRAGRRRLEDGGKGLGKIQPKIFSQKKVSKSGPVHGPRKRSAAVPLCLYPKRWSERAASGLKNPGAGRSPAILSPCFLIKKAGPPPGRRAPRGAAPRGW